jgi:hypothetical protein
LYFNILGNTDYGFGTQKTIQNLDALDGAGLRYRTNIPSLSMMKFFNAACAAFQGVQAKSIQASSNSSD